jgi:RNase P subunit RPR2
MITVKEDDQKVQRFYPPIDVDLSLVTFKFYCKKCNTLNVDNRDGEIRGRKVQCNICGSVYLVNR